MKIYKGLVSKATLNKCFEEARKNGADYIGIRVNHNGSIKLFTIKPRSFDYYQEYYNDYFDDRLRAISDRDDSEIEAFAWSETFGGLARIMED